MGLLHTPIASRSDDMTNITSDSGHVRLPPQLAALLRPDAFTHPVTQLQIRETHISWVILTGPFAYKIKKPVCFDFIDASTLERRHHYCNEELRLNRRLAPELYLDVVAITSADGRVMVGGRGSPIEYAVRMKQFDASDELLNLLARGDVSLNEVTALGELLARFHLSAPVALRTGTHEKTQRTYESVFGNLAQLAAHLERLEPVAGLGGVADWTYDNAQALEASLEARERLGSIRECHGDLHAGNIVRLQNRLVPFDCLEFDPQLRWIDVINDVAFLVMDLVGHQRGDLAFALLSRYLEITGDYEGIGLLRFYAVYRALVRAKVDALTAAQVPQRAAEFHDRLRQRIHTAVQWTHPQQPALILMHGPSGSGKSWLSERLIGALPALRARSDLERKRLAAGGARERATTPSQHSIYSPEFSHRTYGRLADCAENCLRAGFNVIIDAAFLDPSDRELFHGLAMRLKATYVIASCQADPAELASRVSKRLRERNDPSDADLAILDAQLRAMQPLKTQELTHVVMLDTRDTNAVERVVTAVESRCVR